MIVLLPCSLFQFLNIILELISYDSPALALPAPFYNSWIEFWN